MEADRQTGTIKALLWLVGLWVTRLRRLSIGSEEVENWGRCEDNQAGSQADKTKGGGFGEEDERRRTEVLVASPCENTFENQVSMFSPTITCPPGRRIGL